MEGRKNLFRGSSVLRKWLTEIRSNFNFTMISIVLDLLILLCRSYIAYILFTIFPSLASHLGNHRVSCYYPSLRRVSLRNLSPQSLFVPVYIV